MSVTQPSIPDYFSVENCAERLRGNDDNSLLFARALGMIESAATYVGVDDSARTRMIRNVFAAVDLVQREHRTGARPFDQDAEDAAAFDRGFMAEHRRVAAQNGYGVARCGDLAVHGPHVVDHGPDQPRNCPGVRIPAEQVSR